MARNYEEWMREVNNLMAIRGWTFDDVGEFPSHETYECGVSPNAAITMIEETLDEAADYLTEELRAAGHQIVYDRGWPSNTGINFAGISATANGTSWSDTR